MAEVELHENAALTKKEVEKQPEKRYSSSSLVVAADELKFTTNKSAANIKKKEKEGKISKKEAKEQLKKAYKTLAHTYNKNELGTNYNTDLKNGLTNDGYDKALEEFGENKLTPPKQTPWYIRLLLSIFGGIFNILLWFGSVLCFTAFGVDPNDPKDSTNLYLGIVLAVVVTLTGIFSYFQESKSADLMGSLQAMNKISDVEVIRNGKIVLVDPVKLVPGDIVNIGSGQAVPADIRLTTCSTDMEVNNASLTGESEPCKRDWRPEQDDVQPGDSNNLMFFGTNIVNGKGTGVVFATGDDTFMGRTAALATSTDNDATPIALEIKDFVLKISVIAFVLGISFFIIGVVDSGDVVRNIIFLIGIIVANVPEGLLATVTVSLTLTASKMYTKNVRVKNLESVETLGSTSVICSDKTGTLTTSVMTCQHVYFDLEERTCDTSIPMSALVGNFYEKDKKSREIDFLKLVRCGALCNNAEFIDEPQNPQNGNVAANANPTEAAMVKFSCGHIAAEYQLTVPKYRVRHSKLHEIPFNSKNKWQVSVHELTNEFAVGNEINRNDDEKDFDKRALVQMKGAPERILNLCDRYLYEGQINELDEDIRKKIMDGVLNLGARGERVLALAESILDEKIYNISIPEPKCSKPSLDDIDSEYSDQDTVVVVYFKDEHDNDGEKVVINVSGVNEDGNKLKFEDCFVWTIKREVAIKTDIKYDSIRLYYGQTEEELPGDETLKDKNIKRGSILHAYRAPYKFKGTKADDVNFPFRREFKDLPFNQDIAGSGLGSNEEVKVDDKREEGLVFIGLYAMIDPPRSGVPEAVASCQSAGIKVIMVTGDHPVTAKAIAEQVGIIQPNAITLDEAAKSDKYGGNKSMVDEKDYNAVVVPGWELAKVLEVEQEDRQQVENFWNTTLATENIVFARTSPQQKLLIVSAVQDRGGIVAVTGDGVNDSPALKKADIGCAMGITGTDVAKEAADMILLDDNFASIVNGVEEGRIIFDNLKKSIAYTLSSNIPEIAPFLIYQTVGIPLPLTTVMILLVDLGTDLAPAISMAYEGREANIMKKPPRNPDVDKLVTWKLVSFSYLQIGVLQAIAGFYAYFVVLDGYGLYYRYLPRLDRERAFVELNDNRLRRDAYWLWCFEPNPNNKDLFWWDTCIYTPEFEFEWQARDVYYDQDLFNAFLLNQDDRKHGYLPATKTHIYQTCIWANSTACTISQRALLDGQVVAQTNGASTYDVLVWDNSGNNTQIGYDKCIASEILQQDCNVVYFKDNWQSIIEPAYRANLPFFAYRPNRRCEFEDYQSLYNPPLSDKPPSVCNVFDHNIKPRTYSEFPQAGNNNRAYKTFVGNIAPNTVADEDINKYSIYPMHMKTRTEALRRANSAYFISIIVVQWADLMICKTRERSLFEQGMTNTFMNYALVFETILGAFLVYVPIANEVTRTAPIRFVWWTAGVPFSLMIYLYDEVRKGIIRKSPKGWLKRNTYW